MNKFDRFDLAHEFQLLFYELFIEPFLRENYSDSSLQCGCREIYRNGCLGLPDQLLWYETIWEYPPEKRSLAYPTFVLLKNWFYSCIS